MMPRAEQPARPAGNGAPALPADQLFNPGSLVSSLGKTLAEANRFLTLCLHRAGLTDLVPSHGDILLHLFSHGPTPMQELAKAIGRDPSTVTALVRKLAAGGYVSTQKQEADRRVTKVLLTAKGKQLRGAFAGISQQLAQAQMRGLSEAQVEAACEVLRTVRDNLADACELLASEGAER